MVRLAFAAINAATDADKEQQVGETREAQEARVADTYIQALQLLQDERTEEAQEVFEALLAEPLLADTSLASAAQLRYLVLKNLALLLANASGDPETGLIAADRALQLYGQALLLDDGDAVVWSRMGTLAAELGQWGIARRVFEHATQRHPRHPLMLEKLVEVLLQLGDWAACVPLIKRMLHKDAQHPRALSLLAFLTAKPAQQGFAASEASLLQPQFRSRAQPQPVQSALGDGESSVRSVQVADLTWEALLRAALGCLQVNKTRGAQVAQSQQVALQLAQPACAPLHSQEASTGAAKDSNAAQHQGIQASGEESMEPALSHVQQAEVAADGAGQGPAASSPAGGGPQAPDATQGSTPRNDGAGAASVRDQSPSDAPAPPQDDQKPPASKKDAPAPSRASRRLEAQRRADEGEAAEAEVINVISLLRPCLRDADLQPAPPTDEATAQQPSGAAATGDGSLTEQADPACESRAVRDFMKRHSSTEGAPLSCPHELAGLAVAEATGDACRRLSPAGQELLLALAGHLRHWEGNAPAAALLALAELHLERAADARSGADAPAPRPPTPLPPGGAAAGKQGAPPRRRAPQEAAAAKHLREAEAFLARFALALLEGGPSSGAGGAEEGTRALLMRQQWALGRAAELRRDFLGASRRFAACRLVAAGQPQGPSWAQNGAPEPAGYPDRPAQGVLRQQEPQQEALTVRLAACSRDGEISEAAAAAKAALDACRRLLVQGQPGVVVAQLAPMLLDQACTRARALRSDRRAFLEALHLLQDAAKSCSDERTELACRLACLQHLLPAPPSHLNDEALHSAPACGPPPSALTDLNRPIKSAVTQALTELEEFLYAREKAGTLQQLAPVLAQQGVRLMWQLAAHVERCYWALPAVKLHAAAKKSLNQKARLHTCPEVSKQAALLAAVSALASLHQLSMAAASHAPEGAPLQPEAQGPTASKAPVHQAPVLPTEGEAPQQTLAAITKGEAAALHPVAAVATEEAMSSPPVAPPASEAEHRETLPPGAEPDEEAPQPPVAADAGLEAAPALTMVAASEALLRGACSVLSARGALTLHHGAFVKACLGRLAALLTLLNTSAAGTAHDTTAAQEAEALRQAVDGALAQCLHVLYGVALPSRDPDWGGMEGQSVAQVALRSAEECAEAWRHIRPYVESVQGDRRLLARLQGVLDALQAHFGQPPQAVLGAWDPLAALDDPGMDAAMLLDGPRPATAIAMLTPPPQLAEAVAADSHAEVHAGLHALAQRLQRDLPGSLREGAGIISDEGAAAVEAALLAPAADLRYHPHRYLSWDCVALLYHEAASLLCNEAAELLSCAEWAARPDLAERLVRYRRRARLAWLVSRQLAPEVDLPYQDEQLGVLLHEALQNAPPVYDQLGRVPDRGNLEHLQMCKEAAAAYQRASVALPEEWNYRMFHAKMLAKAGAPLEEYLPILASACRCATQHAGGVLEPLYRLHATRLKLLLGAGGTPSVLGVIARCCFEPCTTEAAAELSAESNADSQHAQLVALLLEDCQEAMRWCLEKDRHHHKAAWQLARALARQNRHAQAAEQLRGLFSSAKRGFCINMWEMSEALDTKVVRVAGTGAEGASEAGAVASSGAGSDEAAAWGHRPAQVAANGAGESMRKFAAARRKCLALYAEVLARLGAEGDTGALDTLLAAHAFLVSPAQWTNPALLADIARLALGRAVASLGSALQRTFGPLLSNYQPNEVAMAQHGLASSQVAALLECAYKLFVEHVVPAAAPDQAEASWHTALWSVLVADEVIPWASEMGIEAAARAHVLLLASRGALDDMHALLAALRRRHKALRQMPQAAQKLCMLLGGCMAHIISMGLATLPQPPAPGEAMPPRPSLPAGNAVMHFPAAEQMPHPASAAGQSLASGIAYMRVEDAPPSTPNKAPPTLVGTGPQQPAAHAIPVKAPESDEQAAERQLLHEKALQLLKHAVYLYKAKLAPPVPGVRPILDAGGRPVDFGDMVIRAHRAHAAVARPGAPDQAGPVTAAGAVAAYDDMTRANKRASPAAAAARSAAGGSRADRSAARDSVPRNGEGDRGASAEAADRPGLDGSATREPGDSGSAQAGAQPAEFGGHAVMHAQPGSSGRASAAEAAPAGDGKEDQPSQNPESTGLLAQSAADGAGSDALAAAHRGGDRPPPDAQPSGSKAAAGAEAAVGGGEGTLSGHAGNMGASNAEQRAVAGPEEGVAAAYMLRSPALQHITTALAAAGFAARGASSEAVAKSAPPSGGGAGARKGTSAEELSETEDVEVVFDSMDDEAMPAAQEPAPDMASHGEHMKEIPQEGEEGPAAKRQRLADD